MDGSLMRCAFAFGSTVLDSETHGRASGDLSLVEWSDWAADGSKLGGDSGDLRIFAGVKRRAVSGSGGYRVCILGNSISMVVCFQKVLTGVMDNAARAGQRVSNSTLGMRGKRKKDARMCSSEKNNIESQDREYEWRQPDGNPRTDVE